MKFVNDSFTFVIIGDWNQYYLDTSKIVSSVFKTDKVNLELGWSPEGNASFLLKDDHCSLLPSQDKFILTASMIDETTVKHFDKLRTNFIEYAKTPMIKAYGFNIRIVGEDSLELASAVDCFQDKSKLTDAGAIIEFTQFTQKVTFEEFSFNLTYTIGKKGNMEIAVNQHTEHNGPSDAIELSPEAGQDFLNRVTTLFTSIGYSFEG